MTNVLRNTKEIHVASVRSPQRFKSHAYSGLRLLGLGTALSGTLILGGQTSAAETPRSPVPNPPAKAEPPKPEARDDGKKPVLLAQAGPAKAPIAQVAAAIQDSELARLPTVKLSELQRLDDETDLNDYRLPRLTDSVEQARRKGWFSTNVSVETETNHVAATAMIGMMPDLEQPGKREKVNYVAVGANGEIKAAIKLDDLARFYKKANEERAIREGRVTPDGKPILLDSERSLKYVKLVVETGFSRHFNEEYIGVSIVPVNKPNGEIIDGVPIIFAQYTVQSGKAYSQLQFIEMQ